MVRLHLLSEYLSIVCLDGEASPHISLAKWLMASWLIDDTQ